MYYCVLQVADNQVIKYIKPEDMVHGKRKRYRELGALVVGADHIDPRIVSKFFMQPYFMYVHDIESVFKPPGVVP